MGRSSPRRPHASLRSAGQGKSLSNTLAITCHAVASVRSKASHVTKKRPLIPLSAMRHSAGTGRLHRARIVRLMCASLSIMLRGSPLRSEEREPRLFRYQFKHVPVFLQLTDRLPRQPLATRGSRRQLLEFFHELQPKLKLLTEDSLELAIKLVFAVR